MEFRLWTGVWTALFILLLVMFNLSFLVKYITRFTEDSFAALVAVIFIIDALKNLLKLRNPEPLITSTTMFNVTSNRTDTIPMITTKSDEEKQMVFYFSVILFLLTFFVSSSLKEFRSKSYLPTKVKLHFKNIC